MSVRFNINGLGRILSLTKGSKVQEYIDNEVLKRCEPYVPKNTGNLIKSGWESTKLGSGNIVYGADYAAAMYYGISKSGKPFNYHNSPQRGAYWFERMKAQSIPSILGGAAKLCGANPKPSSVKTVLGIRKAPIFNVKGKGR